jgi:uncharacterized protein (DUF1499 family)
MRRIMALAAVLLIAAGMLWVRLAPVDPDRWHLSLTADLAPACGEGIEAAAASARAACTLPLPPAAALTRLDAIAMAFPRTRRLAGSAEEGRITWETRSRLMGYPDYTTAQATPTPEGSRLDILARSRFGASDWGVNAARLRAWLAAL